MAEFRETRDFMHGKHALPWFAPRVGMSSPMSSPAHPIKVKQVKWLDQCRVTMHRKIPGCVYAPFTICATPSQLEYASLLNHCQGLVLGGVCHVDAEDDDPLRTRQHTVKVAIKYVHGGRWKVYVYTRFVAEMKVDGGLIVTVSSESSKEALAQAKRRAFERLGRSLPTP